MERAGFSVKRPRVARVRLRHSLIGTCLFQPVSRMLKHLVSSSCALGHYDTRQFDLAKSTHDRVNSVTLKAGIAIAIAAVKASSEHPDEAKYARINYVLRNGEK